MGKAMSRTRLVLVEDNRDSLEAFSYWLGEQYTVSGYGSAVEALQAIDTAKPDVLVMDIGMRPIDGMQCLKRIRAMPAYRDIPAVALTGFARDVERQSFLECGFQAVVVKPVLDYGELTALIDRLASSRAAALTPAHQHRGPDLPTPSAATADLDGRAPLTASGAGESGKTDGRRPA